MSKGHRCSTGRGHRRTSMSPQGTYVVLPGRLSNVPEERARVVVGGTIGILLQQIERAPRSFVLFKRRA